MARVRFRDQMRVVTNGYHMMDGVPQSKNPDDTIGSYETFTDVSTRGFAKKRKMGQVIMSPMTKTHLNIQLLSVGSYSLSNTPGHFWTGQTYLTTACSWYTNGMAFSGKTTTVPSLLGSAEYNTTVAEACTSCLSNRGMGNVGTFENMAQIGATIEMIRHPIRTFLGRNPQARTWREFGSNITGAWLAYRYGLKPLISDVVAVLNNLHKMSGTTRETSRGSASWSKSATSTSSLNNGSIYMGYLTRLHTTNFSVRAMSLDEYTLDLSYKLGLTGKSLLVLPWQLVPYSFVVDWFVNVGDFLGAIAPVSGWKTLGQCYTTLEETTVQLDLSYGGFMGGWSGSGQSGSLTVSKQTKSRCIGMTAPSVVVKSDFGFDKPTRVADACALVAQRITSIFGHRK